MRSIKENNFQSEYIPAKRSQIVPANYSFSNRYENNSYRLPAKPLFKKMTTSANVNDIDWNEYFIFKFIVLKI